MDFFRANPIESPYMLLYSTGSKEFNLKMRSHAKQHGYLLNQKGLYYADDKTKLVRTGIKSEKEIFQVLGMQYTPPHLRNTPSYIKR
jgi:DNA polymerase/3'-5' exonuclease PolX